MSAHAPAPTTPRDLAELSARLLAFAREREWEAFHTPKNLAMALAGEAGELLELFQWLTPEQSAAIMSDGVKAAQVRAELADVFNYCLRLAQVLGVDLLAAAGAKLVANGEKYPVEASRGRALKYTELK